MPGKVWRAGAVGVALAANWLYGTAAAQSPPKPPAAAESTYPVRPPDVLPTATYSDGAVKDLTPPGLAEPVVFAEPTHATDMAAFCARPPHEDGGLFGAAEYLLWRPRRGAFDYAVANSTNGLATIGSVYALDYELQSGIRGTLGYRLPGSAWEVLFAYTHLGSSADDRITAGPGQVLFPTLTRPGLTDQAQSVAADASLQYNMYDLELGKRITVDEYFSGRVFGGIRFADIRQDFMAAYDGLDARQAFVTANSSFYGVGPVFGLEGDFGGWNGFFLYTRVSGGLIAGKLNNPLVETNNAGQTTYANLGYNGRGVVPMGTLALGGGWQYRTFSIRFGYEVTNWIGVIEQPRFVDDVAQGKLVTRPANLTLEGFVARVGLAF